MRRFFFVLLPILSSACGGEAPPAATDSGTDHPRSCARIEDCTGGEVCERGVCTRADGGEVLRDGGSAGAGRISVAPEALDFGAVRFGAVTAELLTVTNAGDGPLKLLALQIADDPLGEFHAEPGVPLPRVLAPDEGVDIRVSYQPADDLDDHATLEIISDDLERVFVRVPLDSEFKGVSEIAVVADMNATMPELRSVDFGAVAVGSTAMQRVYVKNVGRGVNPLLAVTSVTLDPQPSPDFSLALSAQLPAYLNVGDVLEVELGFMPGATGAFNAALVIEDDEGREMGDEHRIAVALTGQGTDARLELEPDPIALGTVFVGFPAELPVTMATADGSPLTLESASVAGSPELSLSLGGAVLPRVLDAASPSFTVAVIAAPSSAGAIAGSLEVRSSDRASPSRSVPISGTALEPPVAVTDASIDFGDVHVVRPGTTPPSVLTTIANAGGSELFVSSIALTPGSAPELSVSPLLLAPIAPGQSATLALLYAPASVGTASGTLVLATNDPARPVINIAVNARAIDPAITVTPPGPIDFGGVLPGITAGPIEVEIANAGSGPLVLESIRLTPGSSPDFALGGVPALPISLAPSAHLIASLRYTPTTVGPDTAAFEIASSDLDDPLVTIDVFGTGTSCPPGTWDLDGLPGCEYACVPSSPPIERCNGRDDDCNGAIDEGFNLGAACHGTGECGDGVIECAAGDPTRSTCSTNPGQSASQAVPETCDGRDEDCDGVTDNGFDFDRSLAHCGGCNQPCTVANGTPECVFGSCRVQSCDAGWGDCDGLASTGCEIRTADSLDHCGACNAACHPANATAACVSGSCTIAMCTPGFDDCRGGVADGCETDIAGSTASCGACNAACTIAHGTALCTSGQCRTGSCDAGWADCDGLASNGCERPLTTTTDCGRCGEPCSLANATASCATGSCALVSCQTGFDDCNGNAADGCETPLDTAANCGLCGFSCGVNALCCGGSCRATSSADCGACGQTCTPGMLVISELLIDPAAVSDAQGEWLELYNPGSTDVDLRGFRLRDLGIDTHIITSSYPVLVRAGGLAVLARNASSMTNGGVTVDYQYASFTLSNSSDEVILDAFGVELDRVTYSASFAVNGASKQLSAAALDAVSNDNAANWCTSTAPLSGGDRGTPGAPNRTCP